MPLLSSFLTFPHIGWWMQAVKADVVLLDLAESFQKMSYRNRYRISGANNPNLLTVPLSHGRNQRIPMGDVRIHNHERWQTQHWRTLVSVYKRSPFFDHYENSLRPLFENQFTFLADFNRESILWAYRQLKLNFEIRETNEYVKTPHGMVDIRNVKDTLTYPKYFQVFEDRIGFLPDLSIMDLMFSEGPRSVILLKNA